MNRSPLCPHDFWLWRIKRVKPWKPHLLFPIIRAVFPAAIATEILSVQPMDHMARDLGFIVEHELHIHGGHCRAERS